MILRLTSSLAHDRGRDQEAIPAEGAFIGIGILICACTWIVFGLESTDEFKWFYLMFLPVVAAALRYGLNGASPGAGGRPARGHRHDAMAQTTRRGR